MAVRASPDSPRRRHRNREASETRFAQTADASLSDFGTGDAAPSTGIYCNRNRNLNRNRNGNSNGNGNGNGNSNGNGNGIMKSRTGSETYE